MHRKRLITLIGLLGCIALLAYSTRTLIFSEAVDIQPPAEMTLPPAGTPGAIVCELKVDWNLENLERRLGNEDFAVWQYNEDSLAILYRSKASSVMLSGGIQSSMRRFGNTDLWTLCVQTDKLQQSVLGFEFLPDLADITSDTTIARGQWRGSRAPPRPPVVDSLRGTIGEYERESRYLKSRRTVTVYQPPGPTDDSLVIYMADGQLVDGFARLIEPQIIAGSLPPVFICGIHSAGPKEKLSDNDDPRAAEYLETLSNKRFRSHERFLTYEIVPWMENEICNLSFTKDRRIVFGVSNGGAWAISMGIRHSAQFAKIIAFSSGVGDWSVNTERQRFFLLAGELEGGFAQGIESWAKKMRENGSEVCLKTVVGGHDRVVWEENLPPAIIGLLN